MRFAKCCQLVCQAALLGSVISAVEASWSPQKAKAEEALNPNQYAWVNYNLQPGSYLLEATSYWGDVDIEVYDLNGELALQGRNFGNESMSFTIYRAGVYGIKYLMPICLNPFGACDVDIEVLQQ